MRTPEWAEWFDRHPIITALIGVGVIYAFNWGRELDFIGTLALFAFVEMAILWAEARSLRKQLEELQGRRASADAKRTDDAIATLWERVGELLAHSRTLESRTAVCEQLIGTLLSHEAKGTS